MARNRKRRETPSERIQREAATTGEGAPLRSSDIVPNALAKREREDREKDEAAAESGHLGTGIGDDRP
jgi:hypothetical protein